jgi:hypothetical protein
MSIRREAANRSNARHSTGPRTSAGKSASSRNALTHGLTSAAALLPSEDAAEFAALEEAIASNYVESAFVKPFVLQMASVMWRLARFRKVESLVLLSRMSGRMSLGVPDPAFQRPLEFRDFPEEQGYASTVESQLRHDAEMLGNDLVRLSRYENSLLNQLSRLMTMLESYATSRQQNSSEECTPSSALSTTQAATPPSPPPPAVDVSTV